LHKSQIHKNLSNQTAFHISVINISNISRQIKWLLITFRNKMNKVNERRKRDV